MLTKLIIVILSTLFTIGISLAVLIFTKKSLFKNLPLKTIFLFILLSILITIPISINILSDFRIKYYGYPIIHPISKLVPLIVHGNIVFSIYLYSMYLYSKVNNIFKFMVFNIPSIILLFMSMEASSFNNVCYTFNVYPAYMDYANISHIRTYLSTPIFYYLISSITIFVLSRKLINKKNNITEDNLLKVIYNNIIKLSKFIYTENSIGNKKTQYKNSKPSFYTSYTPNTNCNNMNTNSHVSQYKSGVYYNSINNTNIMGNMDSSSTTSDYYTTINHKSNISQYDNGIDYNLVNNNTNIIGDMDSSSTTSNYYTDINDKPNIFQYDNGIDYNLVNGNTNIIGDMNNISTTSEYDAINDMFDFPSNDGPLYSPFENQLYDNFSGGWND